MSIGMTSKAIIFSLSPVDAPLAYTVKSLFG
jgi:hypothetical protein